jgi:hypothetical protein
MHGREVGDARLVVSSIVPDEDEERHYIHLVGYWLGVHCNGNVPLGIMVGCVTHQFLRASEISCLMRSQAYSINYLL